jgi:hypothetical protein
MRREGVADLEDIIHKKQDEDERFNQITDF